MDSERQREMLGGDAFALKIDRTKVEEEPRWSSSSAHLGLGFPDSGSLGMTENPIFDSSSTIDNDDNLQWAEDPVTEFQRSDSDMLSFRQRSVSFAPGHDVESSPNGATKISSDESRFSKRRGRGCCRRKSRAGKLNILNLDDGSGKTGRFCTLLGRALLLALIGCAFLFGVLEFVKQLRQSGSHSFSGTGHALNINLYRSTLSIVGSPSANGIDIEYVVYQYDGNVLGRRGQFDITSVGSDHILSVTDGSVRITVGRNALETLRITSDDRDNTMHMVSAEVGGLMLIEGGTLDITASDLRVEYLVVNVTTGDVIIRDFTVTRRELGATIHVQEGDIVFSPLRSDVDTINLQWTSPCGYVCLPHGQYVRDDHCYSETNGTEAEFNNLVNGSLGEVRSCAIRNCSGYYPNVKLLPEGSTISSSFAQYDPDSTFASTSLNFLNVEVFVLVGNAYIHDEYAAQTLPRQDVTARTFMTTSRIDGSEMPVQLSDAFASDLRRYIADIKELEDSLGMIEVTPFMNNGYFLHSTKRVYAEIVPGVLSLVSGQLLAPKTDRIRGRISPGFCPYQFDPSDNRVGELSTALQIEIGMIDSNGTDLIDDDTATTLTMRNHSGIFKPTLTHDLQLATVSINYEMHDIINNAIAYAVIGLSLVLAVVLGILFAYLLVSAVKSVIESHAESKELTEKVLAFRTALEQPQDTASKSSSSGSKGASINQLTSKTEERLQRLLKRETEHVKKGKGLYGLLALERSFFQVGTLIYSTIAGARRNSLKDFAKKFKEENMARLVSEGVPRLDFIDQYEYYCLEENLKAKNVVEHMPYLESLGLFGDLVVGNATEQFLRMKFKPPASIMPLPDHANTSDSSVDLFIDSEIELTPFETDTIPVALFRSRYEQFLAKHGLKEYPITPRLMEKYSSRMVRKGLTYFRCIPDQYIENKSLGISMWFSHTVMRRVRRFWSAIHGYQVMQAIAKALVHVLLVVAITAPMLWVAVHWQNQTALYALPDETFFSNMDVMLGIIPDGKDAGELVRLSTKIIFVAIVFYALALVELLHHYLFEMEITGDNKSKSEASEALRSTEAESRYFKKLHVLYVTLIRGPFHILCFFFAAGALTVISLILLWAIIGAVINPFVFLPYAAGAGTVLFVTAAQAQTYWALRDVNEKRIKSLIAQRIQVLLRAQRHSSIAQEKERDDELDNSSSDDFLDRRSRQELRKLIEETGLHRSDIDIVGLTQGKAAAVNLLAVQLGVDPNVLMLIISLARRDQDALLDAAAELGPKLGVKGPAARSIVNLANSFSKESGRQGIKMLVNTLTEATSNKEAFVSLGVGSPFTDRFDADIETTLQILPEIAESMLAITEDNDFEPFCELINENKIIRDVFKPFPMQIFRFLQNMFAQNDGGIRQSLLRLCERLLIADACTLKLKGSKSRIGLSRVIEHLGEKLGCQRQLSTVLAALFEAQLGSERSGGSLWTALKASELGNKLHTTEMNMVKALVDNVENMPSGRSGVRPVQSVKAWLQAKAVVNGTVPEDAKQYIPMYQFISLVDGLFCVWQQAPSELAEAEEFCKQVLSMDPKIASALLALMTSVEGGTNPDPSVSGSTEPMEKRVTLPICSQLALDLGAPPNPSSSLDKQLLTADLCQAFGACIGISRGRQIDITKFVLAAGITRGSGGEILGQLMSGQLKPPLWKQMTPLCNMLGISDSSIICAIMQLHRQEVLGDFVLGTDTILPWLGVIDEDIHEACRWICQLAIARKPTHIQRALINVIPGAQRGNEVRKLSLGLSRFRRQTAPAQGPWYVIRDNVDPHDLEAHYHDLKNTSFQELPGGEDDPCIIQLLTRINMNADKELDKRGGMKTVFFDWIENHYGHLQDFTESVAEKLFDLITFLIQLGEDVDSLKAMGLIFKLKSDVLKSLTQVPSYPHDLPISQLERPRSHERVEQAASLMRDHLGIVPTSVFRFDLLISTSRKEVMQNDLHLHELCWALDKTKKKYEPRCWLYLQCLTIPGANNFDSFTSTGLYAMLNLERAGWSEEDMCSFADDYLKCVQIDTKTRTRLKIQKDLDSFWRDEVRCGIRGLIAVASGNMAQVVAFLHAAPLLQPNQGAGLGIKFGVCTTRGNDQHMREYLCLDSIDHSVRPVLLDLTAALTADDTLSDKRKLKYAQAIESICLLGMFRRSGDPQRTLRRTFSRSLRMISDKLDVNFEVVTATLAASVGDTEVYRTALLEFLQDQAAMSPVVASGLYSIGSGDVKGIEELAQLLDVDASVAEGLVALAAGTPATTRGCLPGLLNSLEIDEDKGMGIAGLWSDDPTSISSLARYLTEARPDQHDAMLNSLICIPGLTSNSRSRILEALDGLQSNSKLSINNLSQAASVLLLLQCNTFAVRSDFGMTKLELDLAALVAYLFKFNATAFCNSSDVEFEPAQSWRKYMPGQYCPPNDGAQEELGAETMFAHIQSGKLPSLLQRVAESLGMKETISPSVRRAFNEKEDPQHGARPWAMTAIGNLLAGVFYAGVSGRLSRLLEALDLDLFYSEYLRTTLEHPGGFAEILLICFGKHGSKIIDSIIASAGGSDPKHRTNTYSKRSETGVNDEYHIRKLVTHILCKVVKVPAQLLYKPPGVDPSGFEDLRRYQKAKLTFECENILKFIMFIYRFGVFNMTAPTIGENHSDVRMNLTLRWAYMFDRFYRVERPTAPQQRTRTFMRDVDWDKVGSVETVNNWEAMYFLAAQLIATSLASFDDPRSESEFDIVNDGPNLEFTNALRFRKENNSKSSILERRRLSAATVTDIEAVMKMKQSDAAGSAANAKARERSMDQIIRILELADNLTSSSISAYGKMFGGLVLGLVWNDVSGGHEELRTKAISMISLPTTSADVILAISARALSHPLLLPRFESTFSPPSSALAPVNPKYKSEGDAGLGEIQGRPPRIRTDASGVPALKLAVPSELEKFCREIDLPSDQMEALYHLSRVAMGDRAFASLNSNSVSARLKVSATTCYGLCAGAYLRGTNAFAAPDANRIKESLERLAAFLGVNDKIAAMAVSSAAGNVHQLRELAIALANWSRKSSDIQSVWKAGTIRGVIGLITGEVAGQLLKDCKMSKDGEYMFTNVDMVCHGLLSDVCTPNALLKHTFHLRCIAGLALADSSLAACTIQRLPEANKLTHLARSSVEGSSSVKKVKDLPIIQQFEMAVIHSAKKSKYNRLFAGLLDIKNLEPNHLLDAVRNGSSTVGGRKSWLEHIVGPNLWQLRPPNDNFKSPTLAPFGNMCFKILLCFCGNQISSKKTHGLVPLMNILRPDHGPKEGQLSLWEFFSRMSLQQLGRPNAEDQELDVFTYMLKTCYDKGVAKLERVRSQNATVKTSGWGVRASDWQSGNDELTVSFAGGGYAVGDIVECGSSDQRIFGKVLQVSDFSISNAAIKCIMLIISERWNQMSGIARDVVCSQVQIDPPPARRMNPDIDPKNIPGWKLLRKDNSRTLPILAVGSGRRPLLALRRFRAFINLGQRSVAKVQKSEFKEVGTGIADVLAENGKPMVTLATEMYAILEGTAIPSSYKQALVMLTSLLDRDITRLAGFWKANPHRMAGIIQELLKPAIDGANAEKLLNRVIKFSKLKKSRNNEAASDADSENVATQKPASESSKWDMIREMVNIVLTEYNFDEPDPSDPSSGPRRNRLRVMLDEKLTLFGDLLKPLDDKSNHRAPMEVLENSFDQLVNDASDELDRITTGQSRSSITNMMSNLVIPPKKDAQSDLAAEPTSRVEVERQQFLQTSSEMVEFVCQLRRLNQYSGLCSVLKTVVSKVLPQIKSVSATVDRHEAYVPGNIMGDLLSNGGFDTDAPQLKYLDRPDFWKRASDLFVSLRNPPINPETVIDPELGITINDHWGRKIAHQVQDLMSITEPGGLLSETLPPEDLDVLLKIESHLKSRVLQTSGTMTIREKSTWFREMAMQMLDIIEQDEFDLSSGQHPLLGTAMFMFDCWTFMPTSASGEAAQSSIYDLRLLLKTGIQLAIESSVRSLKRSKVRKAARQKIALGHAFVTVLFEVPRAIAGAHEDLWDAEENKWRVHLTISWGEMTLRLLQCANSLADQVETALQIPQPMRISEILAVFRTLRHVRNYFGPALELCRVLAGIESRVTKQLDQGIDVADSEVVHAPKLRTPPSQFINCMMALLRHIKYRQIVSEEKVSIAMSIARALHFSHDVGSTPIERTSFRPRALDVLRLLRLWLKADVETTDPDLNDMGIPMYELFLSDRILQEGIVNNTLVHKIVNRYEGRSIAFTETFNAEENLVRFVTNSEPSKTGPPIDIHVAFAVKYFPTTDSTLVTLLNDILVNQEITLDSVLQLLSHPLVSLIPAESFGDEELLRQVAASESIGLVARMPQVSIDQAIAQAKESSRPILQMVSNAITKIMLWGLNPGRSMDSLRSTLLEMTGDMLPKAIRPHVTLPLVQMLNGDTGLVTLVRADIGESVKRQRCSDMARKLAINVGMYVCGLSEADSVRATNVVASMSKIDTTMTHNSKLDTLVNEKSLLETSSVVTTNLCISNGIKPATVDYLLALIRATYRSRWLFNNANFKDFAFEPDADDHVPGHIASRGLCLLMENRQTISKYHSAATRALLVIVSMSAKWEKIPLERARTDLPKDAQFQWKSSPKVKEHGFVDPMQIKRAFVRLFSALDRLVSPLVDEWDSKKRSATDYIDLSDDRSDFENLRDAVRVGMNTGVPILSVSDDRCNIDSTIDSIMRINPKLDALKSPLKLFFREVIACSLRPETLTNVLISVSRVPLVVGGSIMKGPSATQIQAMVNEVVPHDPQNWPQYGSVNRMVEFIILKSNLHELAKHAFAVLPGKAAAARLTPEQAVDKARDTLRKCLKGTHTGRDYASNVVFPLVRLLHDRWGLYGNIALLDQLLVRDIIEQEIEQKTIDSPANSYVEKELDMELLETQKKTGIFPCFDMFGANKQRIENMISACKSIMFKRHTNVDMIENAELLGKWLMSLLRMHQRWIYALNEAQDDDDDLERLLVMCSPSAKRSQLSSLDEVLISAFDMIGGMSDGHGEKDAVTDALFTTTVMLLKSRGVDTNAQSLTDLYEIGVAEDIVIIKGVAGSVENVLGGATRSAELSISGGTTEISESLAKTRAKSKMLCFVMGELWLSTEYEVAEFERERTQAKEPQRMFSLLVNTLTKNIEKTVRLYKATQAVAHFDDVDASSSGFAFQNVLILYHRCISSYLWYYCSMRKYKFAWLFKMIYRMPRDMRESDDADGMPTIESVNQNTLRLNTTHLYRGQFGLLQFTRRVSHLIFNLNLSGLQRGLVAIPNVVAKLMELQRGFEVDILADRLPEHPEVTRDNFVQRVNLVDTFAIDVLGNHGVIKPVVDCIYLNRQLLTGTGLQNPKAFTDAFMRLSKSQSEPYLSLVPRVNEALAPDIIGQVKRSHSHQGGDSRSLMSISGSLLNDMGDGGSDVFSIISGNADTRSLMSNGSQRSTASSFGGSSKRDITADDHPIMQFIPLAARLMTALAHTNSNVFTWKVFEGSARGTVLESVFRACGVDLESPFANLALDHRLCKVIESTMGMAQAEDVGISARDDALALASVSGNLIGLNSNLVDGMLAVVDKNASTRQFALAKLGQFLASSEDDSAAADAHLASATISGLVALVSGDLDGGRSMAMKLGGFRTHAIEKVANFISATHKASLRGDVVAARIPQDPLRSIKGEITEDKLFEAFDMDGSGSLTYTDFEVIVKYLVHPQRLTRTTVARLFIRADRDQKGSLTLMQFKYSLVGLADELSEAVLERRDLSEMVLVMKLVRDVAILLVMLLFIFLAITAFTTNGGFESTVNAILPVVAGVGVVGGSSAEPPDDDASQELNDQVEDSITGLTEAE